MTANSNLPRVIDAIQKFADIQRRTTVRAAETIEADFCGNQYAASDYARRILRVAPECLAACTGGDLALAAEMAGRMLMLARLLEQRALAGVERRSSAQKAVLLFATNIPKPKESKTRQRKPLDMARVKASSFRKRRVSRQDKGAQQSAH